MRLWRECLHIVCHLGGMNRSLSLTLVRVSEAGEASVRSVGNGHTAARCRVKDGAAGGPQANVKDWRC
ncbi:hypothetical protein PCAR4_500057 [Paraburkholderia caribensis]|nr:hypothetical protein PCAR4_500057 [Paraburkholderia caribensis]